eukprot:2278815-Pleurochrysis_carterae.AAC.3
MGLCEKMKPVRWPMICQGGQPIWIRIAMYCCTASCCESAKYQATLISHTARHAGTALMDCAARRVACCIACKCCTRDADVKTRAHAHSLTYEALGEARNNQLRHTCLQGGAKRGCVCWLSGC